MALQSLIVFIVVACCFVYAAWTLLPQVARRAAARSLLRLPLPRSLASTLQTAASASASCHCSGCDRATGKPGRKSKAVTSDVQPLVFHTRKR